MLNQVQLQGRLVEDPKSSLLIHTANGDKEKYTFTVATQDEYGKQATYFIPCAAWGRTGEFISKWFKKGYMIFLTGKLTSYKDYSESGGVTRVELTIERADFPSDREEKKEDKVDERPIETDEDLPF